MSVFSEAKFMVREAAGEFPDKEEEIEDLWQLFVEEIDETSIEHAFELLEDEITEIRFASKLYRHGD